MSPSLARPFISCNKVVKNILSIFRLQKALIADPNRRERIKVISLMIKKRFGKNIPEAKAARLVKRAHASVDIRLKGSVDGLILGVKIDNAFRPKNTWLQKAVTWYVTLKVSFFQLVASALSYVNRSIAIN